MSDEISTNPVESTGVQQVPVESHDKQNEPNPVEKSTPTEPKPEKVDKPDLDTAIKRAFEKSQAKTEADKAPVKEPVKEAPKPVETPEAKAERLRNPDGKFVSREPKEPSASTAEPADGTGQDGKADARPSEGRDYTKPPARFLPRAQENWANVPNTVKEEIHRLETETQREIETHRAGATAWKELESFDQMAKQSGTTVKDALTNFVNINNLLRQNPVAGIERVLQSVGVTPQQYAQHVMGQQAQPQQPNGQAGAPRPSQQPDIGRIVQQQVSQALQPIMQQFNEQKEQQTLSHVQNTIIAPFKNEQGHERYDELEEHIAKFLNSGMIPSNLSERQKLEEAYWMADRLYASSFQAPRTQSAPASAVPLVNPAGQKSITGSPTPGLSTTKAPSKEDAKDLDATLRRAYARATAR